MDKVDNGLFEKFMEGQTSPEDTITVLDAIKEDKVLRRMYISAKRFDAMMEEEERQSQVLPMERMAAETQDNLCDILCERFILRKIFSGYGDNLLSAAKDEQLFLEKAKGEGVPLYKVGFVMEQYGLSVLRQYNASISDIVRYLNRGESLIAVVDEDILKDREPNEKLHAICVLSIDKEVVKIYNPLSYDDDTGRIEDYPIEVFMKAWDSSERFLVSANIPDDKIYEPHPINLDDIDLDSELLDLVYPIAENLHDVWAEKKLEGGTKYGPLDRNGREQPGCNHYLVPFSQLSEEDKAPDIRNAIQTLKLLKRLGFSIIRYDSSNAYMCPDCCNRVELSMSYCPHCGRELQLDDFVK